MSDDARWLVLAQKFAVGACSPQEIEELERLQRQNPAVDRRLASQGIAAQRPSEDGRSRPIDSEAAFRRMHREIRTRAPGPPRPRVSVAMPALAATSRLHARVAACLAAAAVLIFLGNVTVARWLSTHGARLPVAREFRVGPGHRRTIRLADGSRVTLAPESRLVVDNAFERGVRRLTLEGEGYFQVAHDDRHPFSVRAANAIATDIGTAFDVRAYPSDPLTRVAVTAGQVALASRQHATTPTALSIGDVATVSRAGRTSLRRDQDVAAYAAWTTGTFVLQNTSLGSAAVELSRWYAVRFRIADSTLAREHLTLALTSESATDAARLLSRMSGATFHRDADGTFVITRDTRP